VEQAQASRPGVQVLKISAQELVRQFPKSLSQIGVTLESVNTRIHSGGVEVSARIELEGHGVLTATAQTVVKAEDYALTLLVEDLHIAGAPDPLTEALAIAVFQQIMQDPQWTHIALPSGRILCAETSENLLLIAMLPYTPTPTNTPIPPQALATMFPDNPAYALMSLAGAGGRIVVNAINDRDTGMVLGLDGRIVFPDSYRGSVQDLLLQTLHPRLTDGMVLLQHNADQRIEVYGNCVGGVTLGDMSGDICWAAGSYTNTSEGRIYTRLNVINPRVSGEFYAILSAVEQLRR
jgi:hypothetical protein